MTATPTATVTTRPTATATASPIGNRYGKSDSDRYGKSVGDTNRDANTWRLGNPKSHANTSRIPNANATF